MKRKLIKYTCYLFLFSLAFIGCTNDMEVIENELRSEMNNELFFLPDPIKALINYDKKSMNSNDIYKVECALEQIYRIPQMQEVLQLLVDEKIKINMEIATPDSEMKNKAEYRSTNPPEIAFLRSGYITVENLLHELLHHYAYNYYIIYRRGDLPACEEYEVRVLTDLLMYKYLGGSSFEYQGMNDQEKDLYPNYKRWIAEIANNSNYNIETFKIGFKMYGTFCVGNFEINDKQGVPKLDVNDFNYYLPQLMATFWFNYKK